MPVCIAGMHRSGTSMVTKILHDSGLYLGELSDLIPPDPPREEEHWENKRFVRINRSVLTQLGGAWDCPPPFPVDWAAGDLDPYRVEAQLVLADFAGREPWGWKDPRSCLTLPFWQSILGMVPTVIVVRNPLEVAWSLRRRNGFSIALGLRLWQAYNQQLCEAVAQSNRIVTHYDMYFQDAASELRRVLDFIGLAADEEIIREASASQTPELRHHRRTTQHLRNAHVSSAILELYRDLCDEANWRDSGWDNVDEVVDASFLEHDVPPSDDDRSTPTLIGRSERRPARQVKGGQLRKQLEVALARIAELEQTVELQQIELSKQRRTSAS